MLSFLKFWMLSIVSVEVVNIFFALQVIIFEV